jgi:hypothetical protein
MRVDEELPETCSLHGCELVEDVVPVFYGFIGTSPEYGRAWRELFRYSRSWSPGGCSVAAGRPTSEAVQFCRSCREAEEKWLLARISELRDESSWEWLLTDILGLRGNDTGPAEPETAPDGGGM